MSRNALESRSLSLYSTFWSSGWSPVFAATSFFSSPASPPIASQSDTYTVAAGPASSRLPPPAQPHRRRIC
jgi:hypothetical protein